MSIPPMDLCVCFSEPTNNASFPENLSAGMESFVAVCNEFTFSNILELSVSVQTVGVLSMKKGRDNSGIVPVSVEDVVE